MPTSLNSGFPSCPHPPAHAVDDPLLLEQEFISLHLSPGAQGSPMASALQCRECPKERKMDFRNFSLIRFAWEALRSLESCFYHQETAKAGLTCGGGSTSRSGGPPSSGTPGRSCTAHRTPRAPGTPAREPHVLRAALAQQNQSSPRSRFAPRSHETQQQIHGLK